MTGKEALEELEEIYQEVNDLQGYGYRPYEELHRVPNYTRYLEEALTWMESAMMALREHLWIEEEAP